jgi:two-component system sensor histidine kinase CpxA
MAARIQSLVEAQRRLLADVSHELRSPLTRLNLAVELARKAPEASLDRIAREAARLNELVGEVLDLSRAEANPARERVELRTLVEQLVEDARVEAEPRGVRLELRAEECVVTGDPELLRRAVENVLRNAIRYAPEGSAVEVAVTAQGGVRIRDYGPGAPEAELGRLFEPFYRVERDRDRASGGAGLGLAIARRAVALHGGTIAAENAGPGLAVTLRIPAG